MTSFEHVGEPTMTNKANIVLDTNGVIYLNSFQTMFFSDSTFFIFLFCCTQFLLLLSL